MTKNHVVLLSLIIIIAGAGWASLASRAAQRQKERIGYEDTPMLPGGKWHTLDGRRPQPPVVTPGTFSTESTPPADAIVLFNGKDLSNWQSVKGGPAEWKVGDGYFEVAPGSGDIETTQKFGAFQLHVEWREPTPPHGKDQGRGNSGVFLQGQYEIQVLDNYHNITYADGTAGAVYGQHPPYVNACRPPGEWETYDIAFTPAIWTDGEVTMPAYVTVFQNGVLVQNHTEIYGSTGYKIFPHYTDFGPTGPLRLQDHGALVRYRNIWIRTVKPPA